MNQSQEIQEAMKERPSALEPWKNRKHVRVRQRANDMVVAGTLKPKACQTKGCKVGPTKTVKHHVDYKDPTHVVWHCDPHHRDLHQHRGDMPAESCGDRNYVNYSIAGKNPQSNQSQQIIEALEGTP